MRTPHARRIRPLVLLGAAVLIGVLGIGVALPRIELERAKDPGLGVRALHTQGVTGAGVAVAIIDGQMRLDHEEYARAVAHYEELDDFAGRPFEAHGPAMASLLVGRTVGVAPESDLHYFALDFARVTPACLAAAIDRVVERNRELAANERVRLLSISTGFGGEPQVVAAAIARALDDDVFVLLTNFPVDWVDPPLAIRSLGCSPWRDCDDPASFDLSPGEVAYWRSEGVTAAAALAARSARDAEGDLVTLYAPANRRTLAGPRHARHYALDVEGGDSEWAPYLSGVLALALQAEPDLRASDLAALLAGGVTELEHGVRLVDPARVVALARERAAQVRR
jgi:hypothetical protein